MQTLRVVLLVIAQYVPAYCFGLVICERINDHAPVVCKPPGYAFADAYMEPEYPKVTDIPLWMSLGITSVSVNMAGISALFSNMLSMLAFLLPQTESVQPHDRNDNNAELNEVAEWDEHILAILTGQSSDDLPVRRAGHAASEDGGGYDGARSSEGSLFSKGKKRSETCQSSKRHKHRKGEPPEDNKKGHSLGNIYCPACHAKFCSKRFEGRALIAESLPEKVDEHPDGCCIPDFQEGVLADRYFSLATRLSPKFNANGFVGTQSLYPGFKINGDEERPTYLNSQLHHFEPVTESKEGLKDSERTLKGYEMYPEHALESMFGLTQDEGDSIYRMLLASAFLEDGVRNQAKGRLIIIYCSQAKQCLFIIPSLKRILSEEGHASLAFLKKIPSGICRQTDIQCGGVYIDMNIQWLSKPRIPWHEDIFSSVSFPVIYTFIAKTPKTKEGQFSSLEIGLIEDKYFANGDREVGDMELYNEPAKGQAIVNEKGKIEQLLLNNGTVIYDEKTGFQARLEEPVIYAVTRTRDQPAKGYFINQEIHHKVSDGETTKSFKVVHCASETYIDDFSGCQPKSDSELTKLLHDEDLMAELNPKLRAVMVFRVLK